MRLTRRYHFSASHRLHSPQLDEQQNQETFGKCNNPFGHGHNYTVEVSVRGSIDQTTGRVVDVAALDELVQTTLLRVYDHRHLNQDVPEFTGDLVPTSENLLADAARRLQQRWPQPFPALDRVRIYETSNNVFDTELHEKQ